MQKLVFVTALLISSPALAECAIYCGENSDWEPPHIDVNAADLYSAQQAQAWNEPSSGTSGSDGGVFVESGGIGNWYGNNGSRCVSTNMNGIVNVSCF